MPDTETLVAGLRDWARDHDAHIRAAVELLIWHGGWLRRRAFGQACIKHYGSGEIAIDWQRARELVGSNPRASTSELAILDLAVALGENRYHLSIMGSAHTRAIADAVSRAVGIEPGRPVPVLDGLQRLSVANARHSVQCLDDPGAEQPSRHALETGVRNLLEIIGHLTGASRG